jgi:hypothetical protein
MTESTYQAYVKEMTYRTAFICPGCYQALDTFDGIGEVGDKIFNLAGRSRGNCAPRYNRAKYDAYQQREALKLSVDHGRPSSPAAR